jgi:hypothetical protein
MTDIREPEVPQTVEDVGQWEMTEHGRARTLVWPSDYPGYPKLDVNGAEREDTVRAIAMQGAGGELRFPGIRIDVRGDFSVSEALLVAAAIRDVADKIAREFDDD